MKVLRRPVAGHFQRRASLRHEVSVRGKIIIAGVPTQTVACSVVDLSLGGARVTLDEACSLPEKVMLFEAHQQNIYECIVRWQNGPTVGLNFLDQCNLSVRKALIADVSLGLAKSMIEELPDAES